MKGRTLKETVEVAKHKLNDGKAFGFTKDGVLSGYIVRKGDKIFFLDRFGKTGAEVKSVDYL